MHESCNGDAAIEKQLTRNGVKSSRIRKKDGYVFR